MSARRRAPVRRSAPAGVLLVSLAAMVAAGCGGGSGARIVSGGGGPVNNTLALSVTSGPTGSLPNGLFVSINVCVPGSSNCQTINNVLVDTGSEGLRILSSKVGLALPAVTDSNNNGVDECTTFADGSFVWGPVLSADVELAGEKAAAVPVQIINAPNTNPPPPMACSSSGMDVGTEATLQADAILGVGVFRQDCGPACAAPVNQVPMLYFSCNNNVCQSASVPVLSQVQNPVWLFSQDSNGLLISLPSISATGAQNVAGSLIFGIGTQSDNSFGNAQVFPSDGFGNFPTLFGGTTYSGSIMDTGSNALFILDPATLGGGVADCMTAVGFYCPPATANFNATIQGNGGSPSAQVPFSIANAETLFAGPNIAFNDIGGDGSGAFDWGLPFFFGRKVFIGIEGQAGPGNNVGPFYGF